MDRWHADLDGRRVAHGSELEAGLELMTGTGIGAGQGWVARGLEPETPRGPDRKRRRSLCRVGALRVGPALSVPLSLSVSGPSALCQAPAHSPAEQSTRSRQRPEAGRDSVFISFHERHVQPSFYMLPDALTSVSNKTLRS